MRVEITRWPKWLHEKVMQHPNMSKFGIESVLDTRPNTDHTFVCLKEISDDMDVNAIITECLGQLPEECAAVLLSDSVNQDGSINNDLILVSQMGEMISEIHEAGLVIETTVESEGPQEIQRPPSPPDFVEEAAPANDSSKENANTVEQETVETSEPPPREESPQDESPQDESPQDESPQDESPQDEPPREELSQDEAPRSRQPPSPSESEASQHVRFSVSHSISDGDRPGGSEMPDDDLPEWLRGEPILPPDPCPETTKIMYKNEQIEAIYGVLTPRLLVALANQRVQLPGINGKVPCFMQGTKVRVGYNLIDPSTYSAATYTVSSRVSRPSSLASLRRGMLHRGGVVKAHRQRRAASERR
jgi:hypothetical protein